MKKADAERYKTEIRKSEKSLKELRKHLTTLLINQIARFKTLESLVETHLILSSTCDPEPQIVD